jgi:hypothetical protein
MRALLSCILVLEWALAYTMCLYISEIPESWITTLWCVLWCVCIFTLCDSDRPF